MIDVIISDDLKRLVKVIKYEYVYWNQLICFIFGYWNMFQLMDDFIIDYKFSCLCLFDDIRMIDLCNKCTNY